MRQWSLQLAHPAVRLTLSAAALLAAAGLSAAVAAEPPPTGLSESKAILEELRQIRQLLERMQPPAALAAPAPASEGPVTLRLDGAFVLGKPDAPLTMVEFTDLECPFCRQFHVGAFEEIKRNYIDTGKLRYVSRDLPLGFHPNAIPAARAARCAGEQGRFWEMRRALLVNNGALAGGDAIASIGRNTGLDEKALRACMASNRHDDAIQRDQAQAQAIGVSGTPSFVLGRSHADSVEGLVMVGAQPFAAFESRIKELLAQQ